MGLNELYKAIKAHIILIKYFPSLNEGYLIIDQEEKRTKISLHTSVNRALTFSIKETNC